MSSSVLFGGKITTLTEGAGVLSKELSTLSPVVSWISGFAEDSSVGSLTTTSVDCPPKSAVGSIFAASPALGIVASCCGIVDMSVVE
jgi:hypothetical protein